MNIDKWRTNDFDCELSILVFDACANGVRLYVAVKIAIYADTPLVARNLVEGWAVKAPGSEGTSTMGPEPRTRGRLI